ncbi:MAG: hypothetical protein FJ319_02125 [SAR202 cluster bacterium]|nr:hypothetical protein [SAR202 cluster bacterium]
MARVDLPEMQTITATKVGAPPAWALMQRQLMQTMEAGAEVMVRKYQERGGALYYGDCVDDLYERFYNWGLFYAIGGSDRVLELGLSSWNAITRYNDDGIVHRKKHTHFKHGDWRKYNQQLHNEYFNKQTQSGAGSSEWHHMGEGNMAFYGFGLADPTISENVRRSRRFAAMFMGEDPEAQNFDPKRGFFLSPIQTSEGPWTNGTVEKAIWWLQGKPQNPMAPNGRRSTLYPVIKELQPGWENDPSRRDKIVDLFEKIVLRGDTPQSNAATALITNAYLYTGEEKYRKWVLDYVEGWMDRIKLNNGIVPDNIGWGGKIGEFREGQWWGGLYGWSCRGMTNIFHSLTIGAECALLLSGDYGYLDLIRSQVKVLMDNGKKDEQGNFVAPTMHGYQGWFNHAPLRTKEPIHIWHNSMSDDDRAFLDYLRDTNKSVDWLEQPQVGEKSFQDTDKARFMFLEGKNPDWPVKALSAELGDVLRVVDKQRVDEREADKMIEDNIEPSSPINTQALIQMALGAPQTVYNGGLLQARVRYFDPDRARPGLPPDVAALVDTVTGDSGGIQLVNTSFTETRRVIVQAGAFGEHSFTEVRCRVQGEDGERSVRADSQYFAVTLPPSTSVRMLAGQKRFVNKPSYAFPWHGGKVTAPFQ